MEGVRIGFVGLGIMGKPMAGHLLKAGYPLTVFNRTKSKTEELRSQGARVASSPSELAADSDIVITIVSDSPDVEQVVAGPGGILEGLGPGGLVIDMSTISPAMERKLDQQLRERGCSLVDAPVSGGDVGAKNATLAIMAGGEKADVERATPVLQKMGKTITYCGGVGNGQLTKLCNQILVSINLLAVSEALLFARRNGLDPLTMIQAVQGGAAGSWQLANLGPRIVNRDFKPGFMIDLMQKDLRLVLQAADLTPACLPAASLVHQLMSAAQAAGQGSEGTQGLAKVLERLSNL